MEDGYTDCPWRERSQWVGDAQPETLFSYYCFGAYDLARKAVLEFTSGNTAEGWIPGVFPISRPFNLPTWGMRVPVIAWEYVLYSGDRSVLPQVWEGVRRQMDYFARHEDADGLVVGMQGWNFVDWTRVDDRHADGAVQGWYLEALEYSAKLAAEVGAEDAVADLRHRAARLRASLARLYWSPARQAFRKYRPGSPEMLPGTDPELIAQHENFLFSLLGVGTPAQRRQALAAVRGQTGRFLPNLGDYQSAFYPAERRYHHNQEPAPDQFQAPGEAFGNYLGEDMLKLGSPFWSYYALLALQEAGLPAAALEYQRLGWGLMLEHGATSCWEMWDRHTSLCHGWSAAPAMILPAYTLGILPLTPGFARFRVAPRFADLEWARGTVPTPHGPIACAWRRRGDTVTLRLTVPAGTRAEVDAAPPGQPGWRIATKQGARRTASLPPGRHTLTLRRTTAD
jgi:hypothetical protein